MNVLEVQGLTKRYPAFTLNGVSFDVPQGAVMGFIGRNGAGKSTTLKSILGQFLSDNSYSSDGPYHLRSQTTNRLQETKRFCPRPH